MAAPHPADPALRAPAERVSPRARLLWTLEALIQAVAVLAVLDVVALVWWLDRDPWLLRLLVLDLVVIALWAGAVPQWRWRVHRWEVTDTAVYTQTGWWALERRVAPLSRIQTVDYAESPLGRVFALATVTVTTASAAGALEIAGLDRGRARRLADDLTRQADTVTGDAT